MKQKLLTLFALLLGVCSGAWADVLCTAQVPTGQTGTFNPNRSLGPIGSGDVKVFSCSPESKECLPLIHGSHKM